MTSPSTCTACAAPYGCDPAWTLSDGRTVCNTCASALTSKEDQDRAIGDTVAALSGPHVLSKPWMLPAP